MADAVHAIRNTRQHFAATVEQLANPGFCCDLDRTGRPDSYSPMPLTLHSDMVSRQALAAGVGRGEKTRWGQSGDVVSETAAQGAVGEAHPSERQQTPQAKLRHDHGPVIDG